MSFTLIQDPNELTVGADGYVAVSAEGVAFPTDINDCIPDPDTLSVNMAGGWQDLGLLTEAGPRFAFGRTTKDINAWQSFYSVRTLVTEVPSNVEVDLRQWSGLTLSVALGGAVLSTTTNGFMLEPDSPSFLDIRQLCVYGADGDKHYAFFFRRVQNTKELQFPFAREDESALPVGFKVLAPPVGESRAWFMLTDDPAFVNES